MAKFDERLAADPLIGKEALAGAMALAAHRAVRDRTPAWPLLSEYIKLRLVAEATVVLGAAAGATTSRK